MFFELDQHEGDIDLYSHGFKFLKFDGDRVRRYVDRFNNGIWIGQGDRVVNIYSADAGREVAFLEVAAPSSRGSSINDYVSREQTKVQLVAEALEKLEPSLPPKDQRQEALIDAYAKMIESLTFVARGWLEPDEENDELGEAQDAVDALKNEWPTAKVGPLLNVICKLGMPN